MKNTVIEKLKSVFPTNGNTVKVKISDLVNNRLISRNDLINIFDNSDYEITLNLEDKKSEDIVVSELIAFFKKYGINTEKLPDFLVAIDDSEKEIYIRIIIDNSDKTTMTKLNNIVENFTASDGSYISIVDVKQIDINDSKLFAKLADEKNVIW